MESVILLYDEINRNADLCVFFPFTRTREEENRERKKVISDIKSGRLKLIGFNIMGKPHYKDMENGVLGVLDRHSIYDKYRCWFNSDIM